MCEDMKAIDKTPAAQVMKVFQFEKPDHLPFWDNFWGDFSLKWSKHMGFPATTRPDDYYGRYICVKLGNESLFPSVDKQFIKTEDGHDIISDGWGRIIRRDNNAYFSETIDRMLREHSDIEKIIPEPADMDSRFVGFSEEVQAAKDKGIYVFAKIGGIYCRGQFIRGEEELLMDMMLEKSFCHEFFDILTEHLTQMALQTLKRGNLWGNGLIVYDDMANNKMPNFSPDIFEEFLLPRYKKMIATLKQAGCSRVFFHSDGNIGPLLDLLIEAGFEGFNPLEPRCGLDLIKLREKYGKKMIFCGGGCNTQILPRGNKKEIEAHVRPLIEMGRDGGLVIGQASIGDDVSPETYDYYMGLVKKYGDYS
jgi:uroporphyrinogen decarboxylase